MAASVKQNCHFLEYQDRNEFYPFQVPVILEYSPGRVLLFQQMAASFNCYLIQPKKIQNSKMNTSMVKVPATKHVIQEEILIKTSYLLLYKISLSSSCIHCHQANSVILSVITEYYRLFLGKQVLSTQEQARIIAPVPCPEKA